MDGCRHLRRLLLVLGCAVLTGGAVLKTDTSPIGWNSYDAFGSSNESVTLATAEYIGNSKLMKSASYIYLYIDAGWFGHGFTKIDEFGRPIPDPSQYPSTADTGSFLSLSRKVQQKGLHFGLWYMGGVPHQAVEHNAVIKGTNYTVRDIVTNATYCPRWDKGWGFEVDPDHPGTAAWYDSLVELWASWEVDMIKLDCVNAEDESWPHRMDIVHLSMSMERSHHDFAFSLSPGGFSNVSQILDIRDYVTMARVTDDFWDAWDPYMNADNINSRRSHWDAARDTAATVLHTQPTFWTDHDMLPFGRIGHEGQPCRPTGPGCPRMSRYTTVEQKSILTLWALVKSPFILGADLTARGADDVVDMVVYPPLLAAKDDCVRGHESKRVNTTDAGYIVWQGSSQSSDTTRYVAVFNLWDKSQTVAVPWVELGIVADNVNTVTDIWTGNNVPVATSGLKTSLTSHAVLFAVIATKQQP
eukprot:m.77733 g.77733  ORF g.77733 m.77733 type:complete len:471 (-) comp14558_c0_seq4:290-1702(-)